MKDRITATYPKMRTYGVLQSETFAIFTALERGDCDAALVNEPVFHMKQSQRKLCDFKLVGNPIANYQTGYFVAHGLRESMALSSAKKRFDGTWQEYASVLRPASNCGTKEEEGYDGAQQTAQQINFSDMYGPFVLLGGFMLASLITKMALKNSQVVVLQDRFKKEHEMWVASAESSLRKMEDSINSGISHPKMTRIATSAEDTLLSMVAPAVASLTTRTPHDTMSDPPPAKAEGSTKETPQLVQF
jgi:hypothetical protein